MASEAEDRSSSLRGGALPVILTCKAFANHGTMIEVFKFYENGDHRPMLFSKVTEGFFLYAESGNYSPAYIPTMRGHLKYICGYFGDPEIDSVNEDDWARFMHHLHTEYKPRRFSGDQSPLALASIDNYWKTIRGFYNWVVSANILSIQRPDLRMTRPKYESPQIVPFTQDEIKRLLDACQFSKVEKSNGQKYRIKRQNADRDKALILILLDTGLRLGELLRLRLGDVNLENGEVYIRPYNKSIKSKSRTVFLGTRTRQAVWKYIAKQQAAEDVSCPLFNLNGHAVRQVIVRIAKNANVINAHPHKFRHTFAIFYLRNQGDVFTLKRLLGHSTLEMTQRYLDIVKDDIANAHKHASPVDNWRL